MQVARRRRGGEREGEATVAGFDVGAGAAEEGLATPIEVAVEVARVTVVARRQADRLRSTCKRAFTRVSEAGY